MTRFEVNVYNEIHKYYASLWNINTSYHSFLQFECRLHTLQTDLISGDMLSVTVILAAVSTSAVCSEQRRPNIIFMWEAE